MHRPPGVGLAGAVHRTWAVAEKNDWQFSNPRIDTGGGGTLVVEGAGMVRGHRDWIRLGSLYSGVGG